MNGRFLYEAMGGIGPDLIAEGRYLSPGKTTVRKLLELAACVVLCLGLGAAALSMLPQAGFSPSLTQPADPQVQQEHTFWPLLYGVAAGFALAAWSMPLLFLRKKQAGKWQYASSALCCMLSLVLQLISMITLIGKQNGDITINYVNYLWISSMVTIGVTAVICGVVWLILAGKWNWSIVLNGLFLLLCLLSAIQYSFLFGRWKSFVVLGGLVELAAVAVTAILFGIDLYAGKVKRALYWSNLLLLVMQAVPLLLSLVMRVYFCSVYHAVCILLGVFLLKLEKKKED